MHREPLLSNAALMTRRHTAVARGVGQAHEIFAQRALNAEVWDVEGRRFMDFAMAGGFPISGVVGRAEVMDAPAPGGLGGTYAGSPLSCAAALAVLNVFDGERLLDRAKAIGERLLNGLRHIARSTPAIVDVRGLGAMVAIELARNGDPAQPDADLTKKVVTEAAKHGLILLSCGTSANVIRILVPLTAADALLDEGMAILAESLAACAAG